MKYRKKPIEVEALLWTGENVDEIINFIQPTPETPVNHVPALGTLEIWTLEGPYTASAGDWIIKGIIGEFYPCKPDVFEATYELVT